MMPFHSQEDNSLPPFPFFFDTPQPTHPDIDPTLQPTTNTPTTKNQEVSTVLLILNGNSYASSHERIRCMVKFHWATGGVVWLSLDWIKNESVPSN